MLFRSGTGVAEGQDRAIEAARRAISSPLLEGASVNGARGVIINVTGGPDLSLVEVSEASSIVQEAADEDANIIFGAVVDPALKGRVKITVIATGFGSPAGILPASTMISPAQTPIDMTQYADHARLRTDSAVAAGITAPAPRLSLSRRSIFDSAHQPNPNPSAAPLPASVGPPRRDIAMPPSESSGREALSVGVGDMRLGLQTSEDDPDFDVNRTFDVPAFLRRQEG